MKYSPHNFRIVNKSASISYIQALYYLINHVSFQINSPVSQRRRKFHQKLWQSQGFHHLFTSRVKFCPSIHEFLKITLLDWKHIIQIGIFLIVIIRITNNSNEHIHENKKDNKCKNNPIKDSFESKLFIHLMHYIIPSFPSWASYYQIHWDIETCKISIFIICISEFL